MPTSLVVSSRESDLLFGDCFGVVRLERFFVLFRKKNIKEFLLKRARTRCWPGLKFRSGAVAGELPGLESAPATKTSMTYLGRKKT